MLRLLILANIFFALPAMAQTLGEALQSQPARPFHWRNIRADLADLPGSFERKDSVKWLPVLIEIKKRPNDFADIPADVIHKLKNLAIKPTYWIQGQAPWKFSFEGWGLDLRDAVELLAVDLVYFETIRPDFTSTDRFANLILQLPMDNSFDKLSDPKFSSRGGACDRMLVPKKKVRKKLPGPLYRPW